MTRKELSSKYKKLVEYEILRQLRELIGNGVTYEWKSSIFSESPEIEVCVDERFMIDLKVHEAGGLVTIYGIHEYPWKKVNGVIEVRER